jgi:hypothetical protein
MLWMSVADKVPRVGRVIQTASNEKEYVETVKQMLLDLYKNMRPRGMNGVFEGQVQCTVNCLFSEGPQGFWTDKELNMEQAMHQIRVYVQDWLERAEGNQTKYINNNILQEFDEVRRYVTAVCRKGNSKYLVVSRQDKHTGRDALVSLVAKIASFGLGMRAMRCGITYKG